MKQYLKGEQIIEGLNSRYAVKFFDEDKKIDKKDEENIKEILRLTPTLLGLQLHNFIIIKDKKTREKLKEVSFGKQQITGASLFIVFAIKQNFGRKDIEKHLDNLQKIRGISDEKKQEIIDSISNFILKNSKCFGIDNYEEWQYRQLYIALGNIITSLSLMGIDSCLIEGLEPHKYDEILGLKEKGLKTKVALAIGFRSKEDKYQNEKKVRFSKEEMFIELL